MGFELSRDSNEGLHGDSTVDADAVESPNGRPVRESRANLELYDTLHVDPMPGDVAFFRRMAGRTGGPILELGCGTGRVTVPLAQAGFDVVGLDLSSRMLNIANAKAKSLPSGSKFSFMRGDMAQFRLNRRFSLILIPCHSVNNVRASRRVDHCRRLKKAFGF